MKVERLILIFLFLLSVVCAPAQTAQQLSARERLEKEIEILDRQIKENTAQSASALSRLSLVQNRMIARQSLVKESDKEIATIDREIRSTRSQITSIQTQLDTMTLYYNRLVKSAYKNRDAKIWYMYILASGSLSQGFRRYGYLRDLSKEMNSQASRIKAKKAELEKKRSELAELRKKAEKVRADRVSELNKLKGEETQVKQLTSTLNKQKTKYTKELQAKKKEAEALEREIRKAINAAVSGKSGSSKDIDYKLASEFTANKGKLPWPVEGPVVNRFGKQYHQVFKSLQLPTNNGISIAVEKNAEVSVVFDGVVSQITVLPGYHQCILVQHGNHFTLYSKIKNVYVKAGQKLTTGQKIGTVDTIAGETVFHFEIWDEKTTPQNPEAWLRPR